MSCAASYGSLVELSLATVQTTLLTCPSEGPKLDHTFDMGHVQITPLLSELREGHLVGQVEALTRSASEAAQDIHRLQHEVPISSCRRACRLGLQPCHSVAHLMQPELRGDDTVDACVVSFDCAEAAALGSLWLDVDRYKMGLSSKMDAFSNMQQSCGHARN